MAPNGAMTPDDLRAWQSHMGYTYDTGSAALGMSRRAYADLVNGHTPIDRRTAFACSAIAAGLGEWVPAA